MNCPHCSTDLQSLAYEGVSILTCAECGGEFIAAEQMSHILRIRDQGFDASIVSAAAAARPSFAAPPREARSLCCPACHGTTDSVNYCGDTGVFVDRCRVCAGLWLDQSELERIQSILEHWEDAAPDQRRAVAPEIRKAREAALRKGVFDGSRFAFVNAIVNRILDAA